MFSSLCMSHHTARGAESRLKLLVDRSLGSGALLRTRGCMGIPTNRVAHSSGHTPDVKTKRAKSVMSKKDQVEAVVLGLVVSYRRPMSTQQLDQGLQ
jgi:hypothetical protein